MFNGTILCDKKSNVLMEERFQLLVWLILRFYSIYLSYKLTKFSAVSFYGNESLFKSASIIIISKKILDLVFI